MDVKYTRRSEVPRKSLVGKIVGRLTVQGYDHTRRYKTSKNVIAYWVCLCECGTEAVVSSIALSSGATRSCGCLRREVAAANSRTPARKNLGLSKTHEYKLWSSAKERASKFGRDFDLEVKDIVVPDTCPVLGIPLVRGIGKQTYSSPTLDRVDSTKGYTRDNVRVISQRANSLKQDATVEQLENLIRYMKGEI